MTPLRALLFDLDGTLTDSLPDIHESFSEALVALGLPPVSIEELGPVLGQGAGAALETLLGLKRDSPLLRDIIGRFLAHYEGNLLHRTVVRPGVFDVLSRFQRIPLIVVSNKSLRFAHQTMNSLGLSSAFVAVYGGDSFHVKKPDPLPILSALHTANVPPARALMVGDSPMDIQAGKSAGTQTCAVLGGFCTRAQLEATSPDRLIDQVGDLLLHYSPDA